MLCPPTLDAPSPIDAAGMFAHVHRCVARGSDLGTPRRKLSADLIGGHREGSDLEDTAQKGFRLAGEALVSTYGGGGPS